MVRIRYEGDKIAVNADEGSTILQVSLANEIPHLHECGGRARCSTCRVLVTHGDDSLALRNEAEESLAKAKGLPNNVRLACQTALSKDLSVRRLVHDDTDVAIASNQCQGTPAQEREIAILFSDLRGFTPLVERHLPYDIVHILNRHFHGAGEAVLRNHGRIDKYIGDAIMALFGLEDEDPKLACRNAVLAAKELVDSLEGLNKYVEKHFGERLQCGVGIHFGKVVVGDLGHHAHREFTVIGDAVNIASRIESMTKDAQTSILTSRIVKDFAPDLVPSTHPLEVSLKGKSGTFDLFEVQS
ncbi:MAG: adenylate cyclase [Planctomycetota bacterium]|jgi:adenylate cyclase